MADDEQTDQTVPDERTPEPAAPRAGNAAAQAASRARRMGSGRPAPAGRRPRPGPSEPEPVAEAADTAVTARTEAPANDDPEPGPAASRATTRTRVAGRRPSPGPRDEDDADTGTAATRTRTRGRPLQAPPARSGPVWRRWLPAGLVAALVVALAIVDVLLFWDWRHQPGKAERREQLIASVNAGVTKLLSYDYRHLDQDEATASARLTGKFRDDYIQSMDSTIKKKAPSEKAVVVGEVSSTAITSASGDGKQTVLLVLGQQTITNIKQTTPRNELVQLRVTAQLVHGKWLVSNLASL